MSASLSLRELSAGYGGQPVVSGVSIEVRGGEIVALVGPNGSGKSTLLRAAAGLQRPLAGSVELDGRELRDWGRQELARRLAVLLQSPTLPPLYRVRDYVALGRSPYVRLLANETNADWRAVEAAMAAAGVSDFAQRRLESLSGGERQRVAVARALAQEPDVLLLDEPTASLDLKHQEELLSLLRRLVEERGLACLIVLHDLTLAGQFADRVCLLSQGRLVLSGPPEVVLQPETLSEVYETPVTVLRHPESGRPVVVHALRANVEARLHAGAAHPAT